LNNAGGVLGLASIVLDARLVTAKGDAKAAIDHWKRAVVAQNLLAYDEPPAWYYPVRESLGAALYLNQQYAEAEQVFRTELERNPRSGRALFGLWESLKAQKKLVDAGWVAREFDAAWKEAEVRLRMDDL
ncbi:MAG: hypothetical protein HY650_09510, partial [Acidobacteria bacterium]|nr:hypothetical protein [Acidobacteriota bacterium]